MNTTLTKQQLQAIAGRILDGAICIVQAGWTQGACARNAKGALVGSLDPDAIKFDLIGAVVRAGRHLPEDARNTALFALRDARAMGLSNHVTLTGWNDQHGRTKAEVITLMTKARMLLTARAKYAALPHEPVRGRSLADVPFTLICTVNGSKPVSHLGATYPITRRAAERIVGYKYVQEVRALEIERMHLRQSEISDYDTIYAQQLSISQ